MVRCIAIAGIHWNSLEFDAKTLPLDDDDCDDCDDMMTIFCILQRLLR